MALWLNFLIIKWFPFPDLPPLIPLEPLCQELGGLNLILASSWLQSARLTSANIESLWRLLVQVPGHLHLQRHEDPVEDVDEEEVGELVDPEDLGRGEVGDVVPAELQKVDTLTNFKYHQTVKHTFTSWKFCDECRWLFQKNIMLTFGLFPFLQPCILHWETEQSGDDDSKDHPAYQIPGNERQSQS